MKTIANGDALNLAIQIATRLKVDLLEIIQSGQNIFLSTDIGGLSNSDFVSFFISNYKK